MFQASMNVVAAANCGGLNMKTLREDKQAAHGPQSSPDSCSKLPSPAFQTGIMIHACQI